MIIAVSAKGKTLDSEIDPRFGRASGFLIIETDTMSFEWVDNNQNLNLPQGAGIQSAQNVSKHKVEAVLTGNCGPKAFMTLSAAKIQVITGIRGTVDQAVKDFINGKLTVSDDANVEGHWM